MQKPLQVKKLNQDAEHKKPFTRKVTNFFEAFTKIVMPSFQMYKFWLHFSNAASYLNCHAHALDNIAWFSIKVHKNFK